MAHTRELLSLVDAASICCGTHAGSIEKTRETLELTQSLDLMVGAHPGMALAGGRGRDLPTAEDFEVLLERQLDVFFEMAGELEVRVNFVKLHGSLYSAVEMEPDLLSVYLKVLQRNYPEAGVFALADGMCAAACRDQGIQVWEEAFVDRAYDSCGHLVNRSVPGAVLGISAALSRFQHWKEYGGMFTIDGATIPIHADTFCVHSDSPDALELLKAVRNS